MPPCVLRAQWVRANGPYSENTTKFAVVDGFIYASNYIYAYNGGSFRSSDVGSTWKLPKMPMLNWTELESAAGKIFAVEGRDPYVNAFYMSSDSGTSWILLNIHFPIFNGPYGRSDTAWFTNFCSTKSAAFVAIEDKEHTNFSGLYRSTDNGTSWSWPKTPIEPTSILATGRLMIARTLGNEGWIRSLDDADNWDTTSLTTLPYLTIVDLTENDSGFFIGTNQGIFFSSDSGLTWEARNKGLKSFNITQLAISENMLAVATIDSGVFVSTNDGANWIAMNSGLITKHVTNVAFVSNKLIACDSIFGSNKHLFRSAGLDSSWQALYCPWGDVGLTSLMVDSNKMFSGSPACIFVSTDSGLTWYPEKGWNIDTSIFTVNLEGYPGVNALGCFDGIYFLGSESGEIYRSTDKGASWAKVQAGGNGTSAHFDFAFLDGKLFANDGTGLLMSDDTGKVWTNAGKHLPAFGVSSFDTLDGGLIYGTSDTTLFISYDGGMTWSSKGTDPWWSVQSLATVGGDIFVSDINNYWNYQTDFYLSTDGGTTWNSVSQGFDYYTANQIVAAYGYLFACGPGIYRRPLSDFGISSVAQTPIVTSTGLTSYPNPFSESTQITFTSVTAGYADISIVNLLGEQVACIFSGELDAGPHSFTFLGSALPEGMYECLVHMSGRVEKVGMVLLR